jgi:hypothetical protein
MSPTAYKPPIKTYFPIQAKPSKHGP